MRCNVPQACSLTARSDHVPDNVLRDAAAPHLSPSGDRSKDFALRNPSGLCPLIESGFHPVRNGYGADVTALADQIHHGPVPLTHLDVIQPQAHKFRPAKATTGSRGLRGAEIPVVDAAFLKACGIARFNLRKCLLGLAILAVTVSTSARTSLIFRYITASTALIVGVVNLLAFGFVGFVDRVIRTDFRHIGFSYGREI